MRLPSLIIGIILIVSSASQAKFIKPSEAKKAVWAFEGLPRIAFTDMHLACNNNGFSWGTGYSYELEIWANSKLIRYWSVDPLTGEVASAAYYDRWPKATKTPTGKLTREQCLQIARKYARSKYAHFDDMGFALLQKDAWPEETYEWNEANGYGYAFKWDQSIERDAVSWNSVEVWVNANDGRIEMYSSSRSDGDCKRKLTLEDAIKKAKTALKARWADISDQCLACTANDTYWMFSLEGAKTGGGGILNTVAVNARTGECMVQDEDAMGTCGYYGIVSDVDKGHEGWLNASETLRAFHYAVAWDAEKQESRAVHGKSKVVLQAGSKDATVNGKQVTLASAAVLIKGRLLVPEDLWDALQADP